MATCPGSAGADSEAVHHSGRACWNKHAQIMATVKEGEKEKTKEEWRVPRKKVSPRRA